MEVRNTEMLCGLALILVCVVTCDTCAGCRANAVRFKHDLEEPSVTKKVDEKPDGG